MFLCYIYSIMLKALAIFTVLLAVIQAPAPIPRVTADPKGGGIAQKDSNAKDETQPPRSESAKSEQSATQASKNTNNGKDNKDGWDKAAVLSNYLLVVVGSFGIVYAALTFGKLAKQTKAAETAARAAEKQSDHMIASERAWLVISSITKSGCVIGPGFAPYYWWQVKNLGSTPALLIETQAICKVNMSQQFPEEPLFRDRPISLYDRVLGPGETLEFWSFWENDDGKQFRERVETLDVICLNAFGYIKYKTIFDSEICEARFCDNFTHAPDKPIASDPMLYVINFSSDLTAPAAYIKHT
jgi:hypothetical protein